MTDYKSVKPPTFQDVAGFFYLAVSSRSMDPGLLTEWADECLMKEKSPDSGLASVSMNAKAPLSEILKDLKPLCGKIEESAAKPLFLAYLKRMVQTMQGQTRTIYRLVEQFRSFRQGPYESDPFFDAEELKALQHLDYAYDDCNSSEEEVEKTGAPELKKFLDRYEPYDKYLPALIRGRESLP